MFSYIGYFLCIFWKIACTVCLVSTVGIARFGFISCFQLKEMGNAQAFKSDKIGFQVTGIFKQSPGEQAGLRVNEDFILTMNGQAIPFMDPEKIMNTVKNSVNRPVLLTVYNTTTTKQREVVLTPSSSWPGEGLLGIKIKLNAYDAPRLDLNFNDVYNKEEDSFEDVSVSTPKRKSPARGSISRAFGFGEAECGDFNDLADGDSSDRGTPSKGFFKSLSFKGRS